VCGPVQALLENAVVSHGVASAAPVAVVPGSLGTWTDQGDAAAEGAGG
jgi:hypothetical protein